MRTERLQQHARRLGIDLACEPELEWVVAAAAEALSPAAKVPRPPRRFAGGRTDTRRRSRRGCNERYA